MLIDVSAKNYVTKIKKDRVYRRKSNVCDQSKATFKSKGNMNMHVKNKQLNYLRNIWTKCHRMRGVDNKLKSHKATHESLQYNECQICKSVMRFKNKEKEHIVWSHSKVPRHQESDVRAKLKDFLPRKNHKNLTPVVKTTLKKNIQTKQNQRKYLTG